MAAQFNRSFVGVSTGVGFEALYFADQIDVLASELPCPVDYHC